MSLSAHIKPISYLKANAAKIAEELKQEGEAYIITQNGEAAMVVQSVAEYEKTQETLALLKMVAQSERSVEQEKTHDAKTALKSIRARLNCHE
ncbi:prevent-host-death protein [Saccharobesus litoralis]|uniref:Antitoxin n=1 Tax=Saccharobesus litoralis TaxID=2172099 RepID=A0A2S0VSV4_9ALTE|nr:type II toxin-antitoxin system Phd/YefM family antitoxin [Saccharobesus litoralis]AWB67289.1 prevent-host-death protein [Saccharobesus litoralis]